ncbi:MAG: HAMP domain-containing histidine kinase [Candidatus Aminicenantes bacterium]|nr:HAMP domain-containing histidine kinase [Candidatus Aminicenantes bacterium]
MRLDWQKRAVILFAASLLILSVVLVFFAIREAEREKLLKEREIEGKQQRLVEGIDGRARTLIGEAENRVLQAVKKNRSDAHPAQAAADLKGPLVDIPCVSEVFFVDNDDQVVFLNARPLFLLSGEKPRYRDVSSSWDNDERWKRAEEAEFRLNDYSLAASLYQDLATKTADQALDALLVNRLARCYTKSGKHEKALGAYRQQLRIGLPDLISEGIPLDISSLYQIGNIHLHRGQREEAAGAFLDLYQGLLDSRWPLTRSQYEAFRKLAEDRFRMAAGELDASLQSAWDGRLQDLKKIEKTRMASTGILENVQGRIIPRLRLEAREMDADSGKFLRIAETIDSGLILASFLPLNKETILGLLLDPQALANGLFPPASEKSGREEGLSVAIVDESGKVVAGPGLLSQEGSEKSGDPQLVSTGGFADSFPPWAIRIYRSGVGAVERQFRMRRNIYILSLVVVIAALFFGGFLAIRSTAKELKLARMKSDFVATVSHEFRTPLTSIRYMAELLQRGRVRDEARKQQYYEAITGESERLSRLVENLLDFSKIESGMKEYRMEEADIAALAADVATRFRQQAGFKDFTLETEIAGGLLVIQADKESLGRAVFNLLDNAVKYSGENPRLVLRAWSGEDAVCLQVEDYGIGIVISEQKKIFEKFYRSEVAMESDVKGTGIGLPLVEHIVRAHGGKVLLESEAGKGTRVTIRLPVRRSEEKKEDENG